MKLGAENRLKTIGAVALMVISLVLFARTLSGWFGSATAAPTSPTTAPANQQPLRRAPRRLQTRASSAAPSLDPRLRLDLLQSSEHTRYEGSGRNIFRPHEELAAIPKPIAPPITVNPGPPLPPPINLKFFGFANKPGEPRKIFLSQGEDVFIAGEGEIVNRRYKVVRISPNSVEIEDVLNNNKQTIPLTEG